MSIEIVKVNKVRKYKAGYEVRDEIWVETGNPEHPTAMKSAYNLNGDYMGRAKEGYYLCKKRGIAPEKSSPEHCVCSIGFNKDEQKWYGWSHRAIYGFGIGSKCEPGDCHYTEEKGAWEAKTLDDAKQMAIDFAEEVS